MKKADLIIENGSVVSKGSVFTGTIAIKDGKILTVTEGAFSPDAEASFDASGLCIFPGAVDCHSHIWEPGPYSYREDFYTGTAAAAAGGITAILEMPLSVPPVADEESFRIRLQKATSGSVVDFALWGSFFSEALEHMKELKALGVIGFKAFLSEASPDYPRAGDLTLLKGMALAARAGLPVGVHAENYAITEGLSREFEAKGDFAAELHEKARPEISELEAIQKSILFAGETGCRLHICHLSAARAAETLSEARRRGIAVTVETCPHYLTFTTSDLKRCGGFAKCNPPLRSGENREALWEMIRQGQIDCIASDHSSYTEEDRAIQGDNIWKMPAGIGGSELFFPLLIDEGYHKRGIGLNKIAELVSANPARIFGLYGRKGEIAEGFDADLAFLDLEKEWVFRAEDSFMKAKCSKGPYEGRRIKGRVVRTMVRGEIVYENGTLCAERGSGCFVVPGEDGI